MILTSELIREKALNETRCNKPAITYIHSRYSHKQENEVIYFFGIIGKMTTCGAHRKLIQCPYELEEIGRSNQIWLWSG